MPIKEPAEAEVRSARKFARRNLWIVLALVAIVVVAVVGAAWVFFPPPPLHETRDTKSYSGMVPADMVYLEVDNFNGPIRVSTWEPTLDWRMQVHERAWEYKIDLMIEVRGTSQKNAEDNLKALIINFDESVVQGQKRLVLNYNVPSSLKSKISIEVEAVLPADAIIDLDLESTNGAIVFDDVYAESSTGITANGRIEGDVEARDAFLSTTNDEIDLTIPCIFGGEYELTATNGDVSLTVFSFTEVGYDLDLSTSNGDIDITLAGLKYSVNQTTRKKAQSEGFNGKKVQITIEASTSKGDIDVYTSHTMFLWMQPAVFGQDNFGTATYKDGILYAPSKAYDKVFAINASNGNIIWNATVRESDASPCIDGDVIYVGELLPLLPATDKPRAMALNRTTGEEIWHFVDIEPDDYSWVGSPLVHGDYIYYTTWGSVYALNKNNGNPIWHQNIGAAVCSVANHNGVVFVSALSDQYAFNATTGDIVWHVSYGRSWDASPVIYQGMVIQALEGRTCVLNETTGELIHRFVGVGSKGTPLVHDGKIFIPTSRVLWAFDLTTGDELWQTVKLHDGTYQESAYCSPAGACGAIYYQSLNGTFYVIDEADGSILWSYALEGLGFGSPSIGDGCVFITNDAGLFAFRIGSGSGDWPMFCQNNLHISYSERGIE